MPLKICFNLMAKLFFTLTQVGANFSYLEFIEMFDAFKIENKPTMNFT